MRSGRGCDRRARGDARRAPGVARGRRDQERPRSRGPDAAREGSGVGGTDVGQLIGYPEDYDEDEEVGGGDESPWPTIGANVGLGTTAGAGLDPLAEHVRGIDRRLGYHRGGARSAPRVRDLDHTPYHAAGSAIERVLVQDSHRSPYLVDFGRR